MDEPKDHMHHYWIRHKDGYLFCGICKKKQNETIQNIREE
jgi:hypothetical protein